MADPGTEESNVQDIVAAMVTRRTPISKPPTLRRIKLYVREWRKLMGVSAVDCAAALDIERESYLRLERETWRITFAEMDVIAETIGVKASQMRFSPPTAGQPARISLDELIEGEPDIVQQAAIRSVRGIVGK